MAVFRLARQPTQRLRIALAAMLLAFAINSIAHVAHRHDATTTSPTHSLACGYCASFGSLAGAPKHTHSLPPRQQASAPADPAVVAVVVDRPATSAQPRAPPLS